MRAPTSRGSIWSRATRSASRADGAGDLEPAGAAAVERARLPRAHGGDPESLRLPAKVGAGARDMIQIVQRAGLCAAADQGRQQRLAALERDVRQIATVEVGQVEDPVGEGDAG